MNALLDVRLSVMPDSWAAANLTQLPWEYVGALPCARGQQWQGLHCRFSDPYELQGTLVGVSLPGLGLNGVLARSLSNFQELTSM